MFVSAAAAQPDEYADDGDDVSARTANDSFQLAFEGDEGDDEEEGYTEAVSLPEWACQFCGIHDPASVVQCAKTKKYVDCLRARRDGITCVHHLE
jgi:regulator of nonsense transcripts 1